MLKYVYNMKMKRELENWGGYISYHILKYYAELYLVEGPKGCKWRYNNGTKIAVIK